MLQVNFLCTSRTTTVHYYEVTLVKKYNKPLLQKRETEVFKQKKTLGHFEIKLDNV